MKRCPTCDKTFDDNLRFCQADGTPLVDDAPPVDPYKTMVARPGDIAAATPQGPVDAPIPPPKEDEPVLEIPDPNKTMFASEEEIRREMDARDAKDQVIDIPPLVETPSAEPARPRDPEPAAPPPPSPFNAAPPASPFSQPDEKAAVPSPWDSPQKAPEARKEPPSFADPAPVNNAPSGNPFDTPPSPASSMAPAEWTPPPPPDASWQNQAIGQNTPFQPPPAGSGGVNQTLPIISLVLGIVSLCCYISPVTGIAALITGYKGMKNANSDPANYGGKGLAIAGMICGGVFLVLGLLYWLYIIFILGFAAMGSLGNL